MSLNGALGVGIVLTAKDLASGVMQRVGREFMGLHNKASTAAFAMEGAFRALKVGLATMGAGAALVGTAVALADSFDEFEHSLKMVQAQSRLTTEQMDLLQDSAMHAAFATEFTPEETIKGLGELAKSWNSADKAAAHIIPTLHLAGVTGQSAEASAKMLTSTLKIFGYDADAAGMVVDKLAQSQRVAKLTGADLSGVFKRAAVTASQYGQSLDDTLIAIGLFKARGMEGGRAAMVFSQGLMRLASDTKAQSLLQSKGVEVFDKSTGKMRSFVDVLGSIVEATGKMTEKDRDAFIKRTLGMKGMTAYDAVAKATFRTMVDGREVTLKGAAAVAAMREEMANAAGVAEKLHMNIQDTFGGATKEIKSAMKAITDILGEQFGNVLKGPAQAIRDVLRSFGTLLLNLPEPVKKFAAQLFLGIGVFITLIGAVLSGAAALTIFVLGIKLIIATLSGLFPLFAVAIGLIAALVAAGAGLYLAYKYNIGGFADAVHSAFMKVKLAFEAIVQLFSQGGFSGAVRTEMNKAENSGIRQFAIQIFMWVGRIKNFLVSLAAGFQMALSTMGPTFEALASAFGRLVGLFGVAQDGPKEAVSAWNQWGNAGVAVGKMIGGALDVVVRVITGVIDLIAGFVEEWASIKAAVAPIGDAFSEVGVAVSDLIGKFGIFGDSASSGSSSWAAAGHVLGTVASIIGGLLANSISLVADVFGSVAQYIGGVVDVIAGIFTGDWARVWKGMKEQAAGAINFVINSVMAMVETIAAVIDAVAKLAGADLGFKKKVSDFKKSIQAGVNKGLGVGPDEKVTAQRQPGAPDGVPYANGAKRPMSKFIGPPPAPNYEIKRETNVAAVAQQELAAQQAAKGQDSAAVVHAATAAALSAISRVPRPALMAIVQLDKEVLATAVNEANDANAGRSGSPQGIPD
jgi:TP901 family phage tail tape measure protein